MMEFFLSKFWAFLISLVIMGVLVQGIQVGSLSDQDRALNDMADELEAMFKDLSSTGPGLEAIIDLARILPSAVKLTICDGYGSLEDGEREVRFAVPALKMNAERENGELIRVDRLVLGQSDRLLFVNQAGGSTLTLLNP